MRELTKRNTVYRGQEMAVQSFPGGDVLRFLVLRADEEERVSYLARGEVAELVRRLLVWLD